MRIGRVELSFMVQPPEMLQPICDDLVELYGEAAVCGAVFATVGAARSKRRMAARMEHIVARPDKFAARCLKMS